MLADEYKALDIFEGFFVGKWVRGGGVPGRRRSYRNRVGATDFKGSI